MDLIEHKSPALIGLLPKSRFTPSVEAKTIESTLRAVASTGLRAPLPVFMGNKVLGYASGTGTPGESLWCPYYRCAFTTYDDIINAISTNGNRKQIFFNKQHTPTTAAYGVHDLWPCGGQPAAGTFAGTNMTAQRYDNTSTGALALGANVSASIRHLTGIVWNLHDLTSISTNPYVLMLYDRVLTYENISFPGTTTAQNFTNTNTAQRYNGAGLSGMQVFVEVQTTIGSTQVSLTDYTYVNQDGNSNTISLSGNFQYRTQGAITGPSATVGARNMLQVIGATAAQPFLRLFAGDGVNAPDCGVRSLTSYKTSNTANTGTYAFVLMRPLAYIGMVSANTMQMDYVLQNASLERIYDGACLSFVLHSPTNHIGSHTGFIDVAWG